MLLVVLASITIIIYLISAGLLFSNLFDGSRRSSRAALPTTAAAALAHLGLIIGLAASNGLGSLLGIQGGLAVTGLIMVTSFLILAWPKEELVSLGALVTPMTILSIVPTLIGRLSDPSTGTLGSVLLTIHITTSMLGTAAFGFAFVLSIAYIVQQRQLQLKRFYPWLRRLPSLERLDKLSLKVALLGFISYTLGVILGSFFAWRTLGLQLETRSLLAVLTWVIYALMIQGRITAGWYGRKAAHLTIAGTLGAVSVIIAYLARV